MPMSHLGSTADRDAAAAIAVPSLDEGRAAPSGRVAVAVVDLRLRPCDARQRPDARVGFGFQRVAQQRQVTATTASARKAFGRFPSQPFTEDPQFGQASLMAAQSRGPAAQRPVTVPLRAAAAATAYRLPPGGGMQWSAGAV
ncbi:hypothetical protein [Streptomyces sp. TRM68367]|uniref:hypothetical protein n=1 Tax=Streptomyces sp. TRM68367 TaxID=2758415 RepID=UPI00165A5A63|nr:hypothetical protein [Streptomyces sp. TRM68367]MBC9730577.1 hypothetical protein [Streptomyces sp. TRM68367]